MESGCLTKSTESSIFIGKKGVDIMDINGINHITFSVSNLEDSIDFYRNVFGAKLLLKGEGFAYFDLDGLWLALNLEKDIPRHEIYKSYTHICFSIDKSKYNDILNKLKNLHVNIVEGRTRYKQEGKSIYFRDLDGHLFELHTKNLKDRLSFYKEKFTKKLKT